MAQSLSGKNVLVTGAGIGIGRSIALELARDGARVAVTYQTHKPDQGFTDEILTLSGHTLISTQLDMTSPSEVERVINDLGAQLGSIDVLVNNVGGLVQRASIAQMDFGLWKKVMAVNLDSAFLATHYVIPFMKRGWGRVINISSLAGQNGGSAGSTAYAASKAAIFGFTRGLSKELAPAGITVNTIAPGFIEDTPFHDTFTTPEAKNAAIGTIALRRAGAPIDVAAAALWLASDQASFVTGTTVDVNGGQYFV